ncbi:hypothetical protein [Streptomyces sp. NBC_01481]|uniref:hypothetical protein n=1 Tax=Streptomyces sp. NBC_01481 TaxID=2975869 RepID=UPI002257E9B3|nr:hypothetical protein [Streptomyces sp. NBC_01481]MCX4585939.1 hypothetical protein [Streptomyces sp. NBC_01481]
MALGDGIRRNIATVDPAERTLLRDTILTARNPYARSSAKRYARAGLGLMASKNPRTGALP